MADPLVTDVFKFIAIRPPQSVDAANSEIAFISDARAGTSDGRRALTDLGRSLGTRDKALAAWAKIDLTLLKPLADGYAKLLAGYQALAPDALAPDPLDALRLAGVHGDFSDLVVPAWNALYVADATGADAGVRLETPMAALRALHFIARASGTVSVETAIATLGATPLIPRELRDFAPQNTALTPVPPATVSRATPVATRAMHALLNELVTAQALLDAARKVPPSPPVTTRQARPAVTGTGKGGFHAIQLSTVPKLGSALASRSTAQRDLLTKLSIDARTTLPEATRALQDHVDALTTHALDLGSDPAFHALILTNIESPAARTLSGLLGPIMHQPGTDPGMPDVDMNGRIRPLGIGDLKVVKQKLLAYQPGEVAHIENVLKGESKNRVYRTLDRLTVTDFSSEETTTDTERDTQSTDRFELKKEADTTIKEDMSVRAGLTVTGSYGPVTVTAQGDFAYSTSKDESVKTSANYGRDIVDRSISKIQKKVTTSRTTVSFHETEETDEHGIDNRIGPGNVVGVYRWVDKKYRAQIYNYGKRLMLEFVVPEPAAFWRASQKGVGTPTVLAQAPAPFVDSAGKPLTPAAFQPSTYLALASRYQASVPPPPAEWIYISTAFAQDSIDNGHTLSKVVKDMVVPDGYTMFYYHAQISVTWTNFPQFFVQIRDDQHHVLNNSGALQSLGTAVGTTPTSSDPRPSGPIAISVTGYDVNSYSINVSGLCSYTPQTYARWQQDAFDKTFAAYQALKTAYDQAVAKASAQVMGITIEGRNPGINLQIIKTELKKLCLTMLTGMQFNDFHAMSSPPDVAKHLPEVDPIEALTEGRFAEFFEQAFEWEQMTYLFYPYFWGRKANWIMLFNQSDSDPAFMQFLQAGAVRVVLPVSRAYDDAMTYFLQPRTPSIPVAARIWQGGGPPTINDPLFRAIADELRAQTDDLAGATPEGDPWEYTVPTTLVWLQPDGTLPVFK
jgi:hypothetical protein